MLTLKQATEFAKNAMLVWQEGRVDQIEKIYAPDVLGHMNNQNFYFNDITQRMMRLNEYSYKKRRFTLTGNVELIGDLILFRCRQVWLNSDDGGLCESVIVVVYRLQEYKVKEMWIMTDLDIEDYVSINKNIDENFNQFSVAGRDKSDFLQQMTDMLYLNNDQITRLSSIEVECLFYYLNGYSAKEVANVMVVSYRTVEGYIARIKEKFHCSTRRELRRQLFPNQKKKEPE